jgi:hypothetical protein
MHADKVFEVFIFSFIFFGSNFILIFNFFFYSGFFYLHESKQAERKAVSEKIYIICGHIYYYYYNMSHIYNIYVTSHIYMYVLILSFVDVNLLSFS